jgi:hypothetical protein
MKNSPGFLSKFTVVELSFLSLFLDDIIFFPFGSSLFFPLRVNLRKVLFWFGLEMY